MATVGMAIGTGTVIVAEGACHMCFLRNAETRKTLVQ